MSNPKFGYDGSAARNSVIRPERISNSIRSLELVIKGEGYEICDYSPFGLSVYTERPLEGICKKDEPLESTIVFNGVDIQHLGLCFIYEKSLNDNLLKSAFEVRGFPINIEKIMATLEGFEIFAQLKANYTQVSEISPEFRVIVASMQTFISNLKESVDRLEKEWLVLPPFEKKNREEGLASVFSIKFAESVFPITREAEAIINKIESTEEKNKYLAYLREHAVSLLAAPFASRSFYKPSGYAGDFEMMNLIYRNQLEGSDMFSRCLHRFYIDQAAAKAVQNRSNYLQNKIENCLKIPRDRPCRILSLACGPAYEIGQILERCDQDLELEVALLDQDTRALQNAQRSLREIVLRRNLKGVNIDYRAHSVRHLLTSGIKDAQGFDLVYSSGLFDYLVDDVAIATMKRLYQGVASGGSLIVGNFSTANPDRGYMENILDWNLIHRTEDEMRRLALNISSKVEVESEALGVNLFAVIAK